MMFNLLKTPRAILLLTVILLVLVVFITFVISLFRPTPPTTIDNPIVFTPQEMTYPTIPATQFTNSSESKTGFLVVSSDIEDVIVSLDVLPEDQHVHDLPSEEVPSTIIPSNEIPFKMASIPIGEHTLFAFKLGYEEVYTNFFIKEGEITRINLEMKPIKLVGEQITAIQDQQTRTWTNQLPIRRQYYYIEYDKNSSTILATIFPPQSFYNFNKDNQINFLKTRVQDELIKIGVNLNAQKIEWIIK